MSYRTQATVRVNVTSSSKVEVELKPTEDYAINYRGNSYTVFVDDDKRPPIQTARSSVIFDVKKSFLDIFFLN